MNYKTCKILNDRFILDEKFNLYLDIKLDAKKKVPVTDGLEKGYIYAAMFFYDEVVKESKKLEKIVRKHMDIMKLELANADTPIVLLELSRRVQADVGDDSLDALIKEILGETQKHIALAPEPEEIGKWETIKESILYETISNLYQTVIANPEKNEAGFKKVPLSKAYTDKLTERQKKLLAPALKMVGFLNEVRLDDFEIKDFVVTFKIFAMASPFEAKEEAIKKSLKKLMDDNI